MLQLSVGTWCVGQVRGNCMRRDPRGLREPLGCRAGRVDTCDSPQATCPHKRTHKNYCHQPDYVTKTQLTQGPALHGAQQLHGRIWCFLSFFMWFVFFSPLFIFYNSVTLLLISCTTETLPSGPFSHNETNIPTEASAPLRNHCGWSKEERREKKKDAEGRGVLCSLS